MRLLLALLPCYMSLNNLLALADFLVKLVISCGLGCEAVFKSVLCPWMMSLVVLLLLKVCTLILLARLHGHGLVANLPTTSTLVDLVNRHLIRVTLP